MELGLFAWYNINKQAITEQLCVNKDKPELHCEGKCYLGKQLKKAEEGERRTASNILKEKQEYVQKEYVLNLVQPFIAHSIFDIQVSEFNIPSSPVLEEVSPPG